MNKIVPVVLYNQIQAFQFGLNSTKAILMNYFSYILPNYGEVMMIGGLPYYWLTSSKLLSDLPTLDISESTLKNNVRELIEADLIIREVVRVGGKDRAYYRASESWLKSGEKEVQLAPTLIDGFSSLSADQKEKLKAMLEGEGVDKKVVYELDDVGGNFLTDEIVKEMKRGEAVFQFNATINYDYMASIMEHIEERAKLCKWYRIGPDGKKNPETTKEIVRVFKNMIDYYVIKKKKIKNLKLTINTWFK